MTLSTQTAAEPRHDRGGKRACIHCGLPFRPTAGREEFCCTGCEYVYHLIRDEGLEKFYDLRDGAGAPALPSVFQPRDYRWLEEMVRAAETEVGRGGKARLVLDLQGISCVGCIWLIEKVFRRTDGASDIRIHSGLGRMELAWVAGSCDVVGFARKLQGFGYLVGPPVKEPRSESSRLVLRMGLCAVFAMNAMLFSLPFYLGMEEDFAFAGLFGWLTFFFATLSLIVGGGYFIRRAVSGLRHGVLHIDLPIALGIVAAYTASVGAWLTGQLGFMYFEFVSTFSFLMIVGRWAQTAAVERNRHRLLGRRLGPPRVEQTGPAGEVREVEVTALKEGDRYRVRPGEPVPLASRLHSSDTTVSMDWISGEAESQPVRRGGLVASGAILLGGEPAELEALEPWSRSLLEKLLNFGEDGPERSPLLERVIKIYLGVVMAVAGAGGAAWWLLAGDIPTAVQVLVSVLVVSCPCVLGVALPLTDEIAISRLRALGIFVRNAFLWTRLRGVRKILFDKTGTLTLETLALDNPEAIDRLADRERTALGQLVAGSRHPVATCLREWVLARQPGLMPGGGAPAREVVGSGLEWRDAEGTVWRLGKADWAAGSEAANDAGVSGTVLGRDGRACAVFRLREQVREDAASEIAALQGEGYPVTILSGDRPEKTRALAAQLGLPADRALGGLSPDEKAAWVDAHAMDEALMVGDGANDSLAFDRALCRGTPAIDRGLLENKADFYFLGKGLGGIRRLLAAGRLRDRVVKVIFVYAVAYNLAAVAVCLAGWMNPLVAAIIMPISSLVSLALVALGLRRLGRQGS